MARKSCRYIFLFGYEGSKNNLKITKPKSEAAIVTTRRRILFTSVGFLLFCAYLLTKLFNLQYFSYAYYKDKVYDQVTTTSALKAKRGNIYDSSMKLLATSETEWRIFISTRDIKKAEKESGKKYTELISYGLANILSLDSDTLLNKIKNTNLLDVTVKKSASEDEYCDVLDFIEKNKLQNLVFTEAQSSRYYPEGSFAAHTLGFCGSDNQGLYGLEYYYNDILSGKDGYYLYAKDANGNALNTEYSEYFPAEDGYSIVTTLDAYLQTELENQLETIVKNHDVKNRVTGVVMNTKTGAILAMATSSPFNPNSPYTLDSISMEKLLSSGYEEGSNEYKQLKKELLEVMWSNKAVSETYEPGSTFKIVTVASALELGVATMNDTFSCNGYHVVGGWHIRCHKRTGHGSGFSLAYGLQMSCNPTMMRLAERVGVSDFYKMVENFGYFEKSGIDLPSEANTIFHKEENMGPTELATVSFGQRFKVSIINHLTAISAIANDGVAVTPYLVEKVIDKNGILISEHKVEEKKRVVSKEVANLVASVLEEGVSGDGGAKNARVLGYKVAAKTGTSQKFDILDENGNSYLRIGSTVAFAPSDENGISVIIVVDEPMSSVKYGSFVAAPYVSEFLSKALPYLGYKSDDISSETEVENYVGLSRQSAEKMLKASYIPYEIIGGGDVILRQTPEANGVLNSAYSKIILYTEDETNYVSVPALVGMSLSDAVKSAVNAGLNIRLTGSMDSGAVVYQSLPLGAKVERGTIIELKTLVCDYED